MILHFPIRAPSTSPCLVVHVGRFASRARDITMRTGVVSTELESHAKDAKVRTAALQTLVALHSLPTAPHLPLAYLGLPPHLILL